mmetsp:Transcript_1687/g.3543  ORF Transcript_1687/g.3543 Transcript_1687/m.3543 type:complete len:221 (+) Transcript_1687:191-853(+)
MRRHAAQASRHRRRGGGRCRAVQACQRRRIPHGTPAQARGGHRVVAAAKRVPSRERGVQAGRGGVRGGERVEGGGAGTAVPARARHGRRQSLRPPQLRPRPQTNTNKTWATNNRPASSISISISIRGGESARIPWHVLPLWARRRGGGRPPAQARRQDTGCTWGGAAGGDAGGGSLPDVGRGGGSGGAQGRGDQPELTPEPTAPQLNTAHVGPDPRTEIK